MKYAFARRIGIRRINGTDHPIEALVYKNGPREWISAIVCNGIAECNRAWSTRKEAIAWAQGEPATIEEAQ